MAGRPRFFFGVTVIDRFRDFPPGPRSAGSFRLRHSIGQKRACYGLSAPRQWGRLFGLMCDLCLS